MYIFCVRSGGNHSQLPFHNLLLIVTTDHTHRNKNLWSVTPINTIILSENTKLGEISHQNL